MVSKELPISIVQVSNPEWGLVADNLPHDFHHVPGYVALESAVLGGRAVAVVTSEGGAFLLAPLVRREWQLTGSLSIARCDITSPGGYGGVLIDPPTTSPHLRRELVGALTAALARMEAVSVFLRLHPILDACADVLGRPWTVVEHGHTLGVELDQSPDSWEASLRRSVRYDLRRLRSSGFLVRVDAWQYFSAFVRHYRGTMERLGVEETDRLSLRHLESLRKVLGSRLHLLTVLSPDGLPAASALFVHTGDIVEYYLSGSDDAFRTAAPTKLAIAHMVRWAYDCGCRLVHLGGGTASLRFFKSGFANTSFPFRTARLVLDEEAYEAACREVHGEEWVRDDTAFFPAYRAAPAGQPSHSKGNEREQ